MPANRLLLPDSKLTPPNTTMIQLATYYVKEFSFRVRDGRDDFGTVNIQPGLFMQHTSPLRSSGLDLSIDLAAIFGEAHNATHRIELTIRSETNAMKMYPYEFALTIVGIFRFPTLSEFQVEQIEADNKLADFLDGYVNNAATILYSSAREFLAATTGRGPFPPVLLPPAVMSYSVKNSSKEQQVASNKNSQTAPEESTKSRKTSHRAKKTSQVVSNK